jgi:hypothetical protein
VVREAHAVLHTTRPEADVASGVARISSTGPWGTELSVAGTDLAVRIDSLPDAERAEGVGRRVDRIVWQQLDASSGGAEVFAVTRRRPQRLRIGTSAALGLLERGVPTVLRMGAQP